MIYRYSKVALVLLSLGEASAAFAQAAPVKGEVAEILVKADLTAALLERGMKRSDVTNVVSVVSKKGAVWAGVNRQEFINQSSVALEASAKTSEVITKGLRFEFQQDDVRVFTCASNRSEACDEVRGVSRSGHKLNFLHERAAWSLNVYGQACDQQTSCSMFYPSWVLQQINLGLPVVGVPRYLTALDSPSGLLFVNSEDGKEWLYLKKTAGPLARSGVLQGALLSDDGVLILRFSKLTLAVDLEHERVVLVDGLGIHEADRGLLGADTAKLRDLAPLSLGLPVAVNSNFIIWGGSYAPWSLKSALKDIDPQPRPAGQVYQARGEQVFVYGAGLGRLGLFSLGEKGWRESDPRSAVPEGAQIVHLQGDHAYLRSANELLRSAGGPWVVFAKSSDAQSVVLHDGYVLQASGSGKSCQKVMFKPQQSQTQLDSTGFALSCDAMVHVNSSSEFGDIITSLSGPQLQLLLRKSEP